MFQKPNPKQNFFALEQEILKWWKDQNILDKSIQQRSENNPKTFYDGPITANGAPHHGHMLTFAMKDIIPRFWTMKGYRVPRSLGWDCHGIPVEYEVEKKLGFKEKKDIEKYGIAEFNKLCKESVEQYRSNIVELEELMGRLTNSDEEYATMDKDFIESVWWSLKELYSKGLLYEGFKVVPYSTRAGTTLSNAEVALGGYKPFVDPAVTVEFPLKNDPKTMFLAWTTTPWTLPSNLGLAVGKDINYVKVTSLVPGNTYIVAKDLVKAVFREDPVEIVGEMKGSELVGLEYVPPFDFFVGRPNAHKVYAGEHVTTDSGTGVVHLAPYGAEDNDIFQAVGITSFDVLDEQGDFTNDIPSYAGKNYRDANPLLIEELKSKDLLFRHEDYEHEMPMCWRTDTPLIYKPVTSWYVAVSKMRSELVENNNKINWIPDHVKEGRFGNWLAEIKDWAISRKRYWGTPLPVWKSESGKTILIGSFAELKEYSGKDIDDPHRPFIDDIEFDYEGEHYKRITDVIDVWYDSGAMPFARIHHPFENQEKFKKAFPGQFIAEAIDQTRGWFYSLHAIGTTLFNSEAFQNVIVMGHIVADDGKKLSKSKKNYVAPNKLIENHGADTIRMEYFSSPVSAGENAIVDEQSLRIQKQSSILPLWNIYSYFVTYANLHNWEPREELVKNLRENHIPFGDINDNLDAWIILKLQEAIKETTESLDAFQIPKASRALRELLENISKWYIRRSRDRFADGDTDVLDTLYYVLVETCKLAAPFIPFITESMYRELVVSKNFNVPESIHLVDYPEYNAKFVENYQTLLSEMELVMNICEFGNNLRTQSKIKVRQPLATLEVKFESTTISALTDWMKNIIQSELNVKEVIEPIVIHEDRANVIVYKDESKKIEVALNTEISEELRKEGLVREIIRNIQALRKEKHLNQGDSVEVTVYADSSITEIVNAYGEQIKKATNSKNIIVKLESEVTGEISAINIDDKKAFIDLN